MNFSWIACLVSEICTLKISIFLNVHVHMYREFVNFKCAYEANETWYEAQIFKLACSH